MNRILIGLALNFFALSTFAQGYWTEKPPMPDSRIFVTKFSIGSYVYIGNGLISGRGLSKDFWRFDPGNDIWTQIESMPSLGLRGAFSFVIGKKAYVGGGINENALQNFEFWEYDSEEAKWTRKADIPNLIFDDSSTLGFSIDSLGYLLSSVNKSNFYMYDPENDRWTKKENYPGSKALHQICFTIGKSAYIGGGQGMEYLNEFWEYNPQLDKWSPKSNLPGPLRSSAVGFSIGDHGFYGLGSYRTKFQYDFWKYYPTNDSWYQVDSCFTAQDYMIGVATKTRSYVGFGLKYSSDSGWWEYNPGTSGINNLQNVPELKIFINQDRQLQLSNHEQYISNPYAIYSMDGRMMKTGRIDSNNLEIGDLVPGLYLLKILGINKMNNCRFVKY